MHEPTLSPIFDGKCLANAKTNHSHLLPKKSWHVYNKANVERVRRDEALAKAAEEAEEQRMQEVDAARRLAILRGEAPPPIEEERRCSSPDDPEATTTTSGGMPRGAGDGRRPRKRHGEDDTDFEMRVAKEREAVAREARRATSLSSSSAPIVDGRGHIDLFGARGEKNEEAERDKARQRREYEDQYTMRFSNAAGGGGRSSGAPWYSSSAAAAADEGKELVRKNVWGREDPRRQERDEKRRDASDPLAAMRRGAAQVPVPGVG
ncbi:CBF1-interacting co-repressor CIR [Cordyceps fumosorosea ARSEF 2679]|uniref:CBF1-interacting co-repressor CIR n=1 Tax=Cordyceps fumosorosea (strain ARSEF 2679) TaxID=1081104 RepID=A0A167PPM2_CORFA|nr:CBF1-interacting co-repressor CIR [Cordyceps fumosorosea ARSEF 2679]OAA56892.1 CBF1-interacting co-repressor CIR [Cordyceps fumosorosea ARSEF 2679]